MTTHNLFSLTTIVYVIFITLHVPSHAQNSEESFLDAHNLARHQVGVGSMTWDESVANFTRGYVNQRLGDCNLVPSSNGMYGDNVAKGGGSFMADAAVELWVKEKSNYNYTTNSCVRGDCVHYTQVVWRLSVRLGCARAQCKNGWWFVACNYAPPGNVIGESPY